MAEITPQNMAEKLLAAGFQRTEPSATALSDPIADTPMVVTLDQLRPYDHGPRKKRNPAYEEIKASNGFHSDTTSPTRMTSCDARPCRMGLIRRVPCNTTAASSCNTVSPGSSNRMLASPSANRLYRRQGTSSPGLIQ